MVNLARMLEPFPEAWADQRRGFAGQTFAHADLPDIHINDNNLGGNDRDG